MKLKIIVLFILGTCSSELFAQFIVQRGTLSTSETSVVSVQGNLTILGNVHHRGSLLVYNHLLSNDGLTSSAGSLYLVGSDQHVQLINVSLSTLSIQGGGTKQLTGNMTVLNELSLTEGIIQTNTLPSELILTPSARINGGSDQSYVDGFLYHSGTGEKFYPVGHNGTYAPATLLNIQGDEPTVGLAYFSSPAIEGIPFHWQQRVLRGTYEGSHVELTFTSPNEDYLNYPDGLRVLAAQEGSALYTSLGQSSLTEQNNRFTLTSDQPTTLPWLTVGFDFSTDQQNLYLPNAFSPTAPDAEDRVVKVYGQKISGEDFYFAIQDTWGNVVYKTTSWEEASVQGWSGRIQGLTRGSATYRYLLEGTFIGGRRFRRTGTIVQY